MLSVFFIRIATYFPYVGIFCNASSNVFLKIATFLRHFSFWFFTHFLWPKVLCVRREAAPKGYIPHLGTTSHFVLSSTIARV